MSLFHELHAFALGRCVSRKPTVLRRKLGDDTIILKPSAAVGGFTEDATRAALQKDGATAEFRGDVGEWQRNDPGIRLAGADAAEFFDRGGLPAPAEGETAPPPATGDAPDGSPAAESPRPRARRAG